MAERLLDVTTTIPVPNPTFRVVVENGSLNQLAGLLQDEGLLSDRVFVLTDRNVGGIYRGAVLGSLRETDIDVHLFEMDPGEGNKNQESCNRFKDGLADYNATRRETIVALGGGVVGDTAGYVAATWNRGVPLVQVPTTVLAMVDSSVGGKTGIDHPKWGKNKDGAFKQPELVVVDPTVLETLPQRVYTEGLGEVAKYGMLDASFMPLLERDAERVARYSAADSQFIGQIIAKCIQQKTRVVVYDPQEKLDDGRVQLNLGHTLAHGLEAGGGYGELLHGEAVAIGMSFIAEFAVKRGDARQEMLDRQTSLLQRLGLPTRYAGDATVDDVLRHMAKDKKNFGEGRTRLVIPTEVGGFKVEQVDNSEVAAAVHDFMTR